MKTIVSASTMADLERQAYALGFQEKDFMENAGIGISNHVIDFIEQHHFSHHVWLFCGKGNNAGDAFVAGRHLLKAGFIVKAIQYEKKENCSKLCQTNRELFVKEGGEIFTNTQSFDAQGVILDGIFGTGFVGEVSNPYSELIEFANKSKLPILSIDVPSGLNGSTGECGQYVIHSTETIFLGLPKLGFFINEGWEVTGKLKEVNFGLPSDLIKNHSTEFSLITKESVATFLPQVKRTRHKYQTGLVNGLAGSSAMPGAAILSSHAALRGGCGMMRLFYPKGIETELSSAPPEIIKIPFEFHHKADLEKNMNKKGSIFVGPGLGRSHEMSIFLYHLLPNLLNPCVIDADALFLYAENPFQLPKQTIMTPHHGEMKVLLNSDLPFILNLDTLNLCKNYAEQHQVTLVLKGSPTFIFHPGEPIYINPSGDPGMATAGSGDVLTGLIASLLSQNLNCVQAALLGVFLHGYAGELAAKARNTSRGLLASDLINHLGDAFANLEQNI
ncbi:MAG: NAD(P)H-hydrate dehydratase [Parachlamydiaceae bacterium]|nr:NAD(P)H-hydrate dehydratase [Parachlamydiaceae bacterium]